MSKLPHLLVVEDDPAVQSLTTAFLETEGFQVTAVESAAETHASLQTATYDLILLDLGLPDEDGLVVARQIRSKSEVPIIFVTNRSDDADKIAALEMGGDDYVTKPFNPKELSARIKSVLRRTGSLGRNSPDAIMMKFGNWQLDLEGRQLLDRGNIETQLTRAEFDLVSALVSASGRVLSRDQLLDAISQGEEVTDRTVDVLVSRIRKKIEQDRSNPQIIVTVPGIGYRLGQQVK